MSRAWPGWLARRAAPVALAALCFWLARDRLADIDWRLVRSELGEVSALQWLAALVATAVSYQALGRYDAVLHRLLKTGVGRRAAALSGISAIAISQTTGLGLLVGTLTRWRFLPMLTLADAASVTMAVTLSFLVGWAVVTALSVGFFMPSGVPWEAPLRAAATLALAAVGGVIMLFLWHPQLTIGRWRLACPPLLTLLRILCLTAVDTVAAALTLYALLPADAAPALAAFVPAFLLALGAGLLSGTPGGIGPFEIVLASLLPQIGAEPLAAAILSYRVLYYAVPALLAGALLAICPIGDEPRPDDFVSCPSGGATMEAVQRAASRAESLIAAQGQHCLLLTRGGAPAWLVGRTGQTLTALFEPLRNSAPFSLLLSRLAGLAAIEDRLPCLYKIGARNALAACRAGWIAHPVAEEFWLRPDRFHLHDPARAGLRRKLRRAAAAGVSIAAWEPGDGKEILPWGDMEAIARSWADAHGGERGFSIGRFERQYLSGQRIYLASAGGRLLGFASFHVLPGEWTLDLMRQHCDCADGTMAALITRAINDAAARGVPRLSLAAAPLPTLGLSGWPGRLAARYDNHVGLRRFKEMFAPCRARLYLAAPSRLALVVAGLDLTRAIRHPPPLSPAGGLPLAARGSNPSHKLCDEVAFE